MPDFSTEKPGWYWCRLEPAKGTETFNAPAPEKLPQVVEVKLSTSKVSCPSFTLIRCVQRMVSPGVLRTLVLSSEAYCCKSSVCQACNWMPPAAKSGTVRQFNSRAAWKESVCV